MQSLNDLYDDFILDHFECPYHKGALADATCAHCGKNPLCGDRVTIQLRVNDEGIIEEAWFDGTGCAISQAAASILCQHVEGRSVAEVERITPQEMLELLKVPLTATRQRCGLLSFKVMKTALYSDGRPREEIRPQAPSESAAL